MLWRPQSDKVRKYKKIRETGRNLNSKIFKVVPKDVMQRAAKDMGILHKGVFVFDSEEEMSFLQDRLTYDVRWDGKSTLEHFEIERGSDLSAEEIQILEGMKDAYFSLFEVVGNVSNESLQLSDLLSDNQLELMDINLSISAPRGSLIATRIIKIEDICMTSGVAYPFLPEQRDILISGLKARQTDRRSRKKRAVRRRTASRTDPADPRNRSLYFFKQYKRLSPVEIRMSDEVLE